MNTGRASSLATAGASRAPLTASLGTYARSGVFVARESRELKCRTLRRRLAFYLTQVRP